jgi:hypothetical protein
MQRGGASTLRRCSGATNAEATHFDWLSASSDRANIRTNGEISILKSGYLRIIFGWAFLNLQIIILLVKLSLHLGV